MHKTKDGIHYSIEVCNKGATLLLFDRDDGEATRIDEFKSVREVLEYVDDLDSWVKWRNRSNN